MSSRARMMLMLADGMPYTAIEAAPGAVRPPWRSGSSASSRAVWPDWALAWFAKIERDVIARGIFTSVTDLARKLRRYIRQYNRTATPFRWSYADPRRRIGALSNS